MVSAVGVSTTQVKFSSSKLHFGLVFFATSNLCLVAPAFGQGQVDKQRITIEDVVDSPLPAVFGLKWHDDEQLIAQTSADMFSLWGAEDSAGAVLSIPINGDRPEAISAGKFFSLSHNGERFVSLVDGVWTMTDMQRGEKVQLRGSEHSSGIVEARPSGPPVWSSDDRYIAVSRLFSIYSDAGRRSAEENTNDPRVVDLGLVADAATSAFSEVIVFDTLHPDLTPHRLRVAGIVVELSWGVNDDLYFVGGKSPDDDGSARARALLKWRVGEEDASSVLTSDAGILPYVEVSPDGRYAALVADLDNGTSGVFYSLFVVNLSDGTTKRLTHSVRVAQEYVWSHASDRIFFPARVGGLDQLYEVDLAGNLRTIANGLRRHSLLDVSPNGGSISFYTEDLNGCRDIRVHNFKTGHERVVQTITDPGDKFSFGRVERIQWPSGDGFDVYGLLVFPPGYDPAISYPLLVDLHGGGPGMPILLMGALTSGIVQGPLEWHASAAMGYVVFIPDFRSSGDYGPLPDRIRRSEGDFGFIDADVRDILAGVAEVRTRYDIDASKIAVFGHSAGGARANRLLQVSNVFSAGILNEAIAGDALSTLVANATGPRTGSNFENVLSGSHNGRLTDAYEEYTANFVFEGYKNTTPTLIMVGGNPDRLAVPPLASEMLFSTLRVYGVPTRMLRFVEEGHNYRDPEIAVLAFNEMHQWLKTHMPETLE